MKRLVFPITFVLLLFVSPSVSAKDKSLLGQARDPDRLLNLHSFCVTTTGLGAGQAADVTKFVANQSGPKKLLSKLPWRIMGNCSEADAEAKFQFEETEEVAQATGGGTIQSAVQNSVPEPAFKATILLTDRASGKLLYQVQGEPVHDRRDLSLASPFSKLIKDLKTLSK